MAYGYVNAAIFMVRSLTHHNSRHIINSRSDVSALWRPWAEPRGVRLS